MRWTKRKKSWYADCCSDHMSPWLVLKFKIFMQGINGMASFVNLTMQWIWRMLCLIFSFLLHIVNKTLQASASWSERARFPICIMNWAYLFGQLSNVASKCFRKCKEQSHTLYHIFTLSAELGDEMNEISLKATRLSSQLNLYMYI